MITIAIINYGLCNLDSVARAIIECGANARLTSSPEEIAKADKIILPGVGAFDQAMENLQKSGMREALDEAVLKKGTPYLGICLGMQLVADYGNEGARTKGLSWIAGEIVPLQSSIGERIPHMGWNEVMPFGECSLFNGIEPNSDFYFVHGYHFKSRDDRYVVGRTPYCDSFVSAIAKDNILGVQFHPEKSQKVGAQVLTNFIGM